MKYSGQMIYNNKIVGNSIPRVLHKPHTKADGSRANGRAFFPPSGGFKKNKKLVLIIQTKNLQIKNHEEGPEWKLLQHTLFKA